MSKSGVTIGIMGAAAAVGAALLYLAGRRPGGATTEPAPAAAPGFVPQVGTAPVTAPPAGQPAVTQPPAPGTVVATTPAGEPITTDKVARNDAAAQDVMGLKPGDWYSSGGLFWRVGESRPFTEAEMTAERRKTDPNFGKFFDQYTGQWRDGTEPERAIAKLEGRDGTVTITYQDKVTGAERKEVIFDPLVFQRYQGVPYDPKRPLKDQMPVGSHIWADNPMAIRDGSLKPSTTPVAVPAQAPTTPGPLSPAPAPAPVQQPAPQPLPAPKPASTASSTQPVAAQPQTAPKPASTASAAAAPAPAPQTQAAPKPVIPAPAAAPAAATKTATPAPAATPPATQPKPAPLPTPPPAPVTQTSYQRTGTELDRLVELAEKAGKNPRDVSAYELMNAGMSASAAMKLVTEASDALVKGTWKP